MCGKFCFWLKIVALLLFCGLNIYLFICSYGISYQYEMAREHTRFRKWMPTMDSWVNSPFGKLNSYLFNVTNAEAFLNGTDKRIKLQQIGPIAYSILGSNEELERNESTVTYRKNRYGRVQFLPEDSVSPDILNQTITMFNAVLLSTAVQMKDWDFYVKYAFNTITIAEQPFITNTVYNFLWDLSPPVLKMLANVIPFISSNCGTLHNALSEREEVYTVRIGDKNGIENFFRLESLNRNPIIKEQKSRIKEMHAEDSDEERCPIDVRGGFDNSLFPPFLTKDTKLNIVAIESCRTILMHYQRDQVHNGLTGYRYSLLQEEGTKTPRCMDSTYGTKLPLGMFDGSKCVINNAPSAFSGPQFYGSNYNWSEHFEGLAPNAEEHHPYILIEPITGIPLEEKYRFQSNIPMPNLISFNRRLAKLSNMILPVFWYEFDLGELPALVMFLIRFQVFVMPVLQPTLMTLFVACAIWSALKAVLLFCGLSYRHVYEKICGGGTSNTLLETTFPHAVTQFPLTAK